MNLISPRSFWANEARLLWEGQWGPSNWHTNTHGWSGGIALKEMKLQALKFCPKPKIPCDPRLDVGHHAMLISGATSRKADPLGVHFLEMGCSDEYANIAKKLRWHV